MKTRNRIVTLCLFAAVCTGTLFAQAPRTMSYQGLLLDGANKPVTGTRQITVIIYDTPTGGSPLHTETFSTQVDNGIFNVVLGSVTALESSLTFDKAYWLGVSVDGRDEMSPRTALTSAPYALRTPIADLAAGLTSDVKGVVTSVNEISGAIRISGDSTVTVTENGQQISLHSNFAGVRSLNGQTGQIKLIAGNGTTITPGAGTLTITAAGGSGGTGIQGVSNSDGTISITNPFGPTATIGLTGVGTATSGQILTANGSGGANWQNNNALSSVSADLPLTGNGTAASHLAIAQANASTNGYLSSADWTTFNNKLSSVTADLPLSGSGTAASHLKITNGTSTGDVLTWNGSAWTSVPASSVTADLPLTGSGTAASHLKITNGTTNGNVLTWNGSAWVSAAPGNSTGWALTGNSGTTPGTNYIGTSDNAAFEIHVYNSYITSNEGTGRVLRIEPKTGTGSSPNWIGGYQGNYVASGVVGATIAGGGRLGCSDSVLGDLGSIGGGAGNAASNFASTIPGGFHNKVIADFGSIGGGAYNVAGSSGSVGGGAYNEAGGSYSVVCGGFVNIIGLESAFSVVSGGNGNSANGYAAVVSGGLNNFSNGYASVIGGGGFSGYYDDSGNWVMGTGNVAAGDYSVVSGGGVDSVSGAANDAEGEYDVISGGMGNLVSGAFSTIAGGALLHLSGGGSFGFNNSSSNRDSAIVSATGTAYFGNVNLWLGNTSNTASQLRFFEAQSSKGTFPASGTNYTAFKAGTQSADITYTLPSSAPAASGNLLLATSGSASAMSWSSGLVWDNSNTRLGVNTSTPRAEVDVNSTGAIIIPVGTTGQRPATPVQGMIRYNTTTGKFEGYDGTAWQNLN